MRAVSTLACLLLVFSLALAQPVLVGSTPAYSSPVLVNSQPFTVAAFNVTYTSPVTGAYLSYGVGYKVTACSVAVVVSGTATITCPKGAVFNTVGTTNVYVNVLSTSNLVLTLPTIVKATCPTISYTTDATSTSGVPFHVNITNSAGTAFGMVQVSWGIGQAVTTLTNVSSPVLLNYTYVPACAWVVTIYACPEQTPSGQCDGTCASYWTLPVLTVYAQPAISAAPTNLPSQLIINATLPTATFPQANFTVYTHVPLLQAFANFGDGSGNLTCAISNGYEIVNRPVYCPQHVYTAIGNYSLFYYFSDQVFPPTIVNYNLTIHS